MNDLTAYIDRGEWIVLYDENEQGHVLNFVYSLLKWLERDSADEVQFTVEGIIWYRDKVEVGRFPFSRNMPQPIPSFSQMFQLVIERDATIRQYVVSAPSYQLTLPVP